MAEDDPEYSGTPAEAAAAPAHTVFHCKSHSIKTLCSLLPCMRGDAKDQVIILTIAKDSILFVVEDPGKCMQANSFVSAADNFETFNLTFADDSCASIDIALNLKVLIDTLLIFGPGSVRDTSLSMSYSSMEPDRFQLVLEQEGVVTECTLVTQVCWDRDVNYNQIFLASTIENQLIMKSVHLHHVFAEVADNPDVDLVEIAMSPQPPYLRFTAHGSLMTCEVDFMDKSEPFVSFESQSEQRQLYALPFLKMAFRALHVATNTFIRINAEGVICVQHTLVNIEQESESVVAFVIFPQEMGSE